MKPERKKHVNKETGKIKRTPLSADTFTHTPCQSSGRDLPIDPMRL